MELIPDTAIVAKNLIENRLWAQGKFSIILLKKHSNEMTPNNIDHILTQHLSQKICLAINEN